MKQDVDLILAGGTAITVDGERRVIRDAGIAIKKDKIVFVGKKKSLLSQYQAKRTYECTDKVISPGFVNAHIHFSHHLSRGLIPDNLGGSPWSNYIHSKVSPYIKARNEIWAAKALLVEVLKSGTTAFMEPGSCPSVRHHSIGHRRDRHQRHDGKTVIRFGKPRSRIIKGKCGQDPKNSRTISERILGLETPY